MSLLIKKTGAKGERLAALYLKRLGYKILKTNFRVRMKEIDIVCEDNEFIVFVEVKTMAPHEDGTFAHRPSQYVDRNKKNNLILAALGYMKKYSPPLIPRIDVLEVYLSDPPKIEHIRGAVNRNDLKLRGKKR